MTWRTETRGTGGTQYEVRTLHVPSSTAEDVRKVLRDACDPDKRAFDKRVNEIERACESELRRVVRLDADYRGDLAARATGKAFEKRCRDLEAATGRDLVRERQIEAATGQISEQVTGFRGKRKNLGPLNLIFESQSPADYAVAILRAVDDYRGAKSQNGSAGAAYRLGFLICELSAKRSLDEAYERTIWVEKQRTHGPRRYPGNAKEKQQKQDADRLLAIEIATEVRRLDVPGNGYTRTAIMKRILRKYEFRFQSTRYFELLKQGKSLISAEG